MAARPQEVLFVVLNGSSESPTNASPASGSGMLTLNSDYSLTYNIPYTNLAGTYTASHSHARLVRSLTLGDDAQFGVWVSVSKIAFAFATVTLPVFMTCLRSYWRSKK
jgi:hypothetical protein